MDPYLDPYVTTYFFYIPYQISSHLTQIPLLDQKQIQMDVTGFLSDEYVFWVGGSDPEGPSGQSWENNWK
jgi:hypothetical protein